MQGLLHIPDEILLTTTSADSRGKDCCEGEVMRDEEHQRGESTRGSSKGNDKRGRSKLKEEGE